MLRIQEPPTPLLWGLEGPSDVDDLTRSMNGKGTFSPLKSQFSRDVDLRGWIPGSPLGNRGGGTTSACWPNPRLSAPPWARLKVSPKSQPRGPQGGPRPPVPPPPSGQRPQGAAGAPRSGPHPSSTHTSFIQLMV